MPDTEVIEGTAVAIIPPPDRLSERTPAGTVELATQMATVLSDIVEKKGLFATIKGKRYPTVEAWMTIARMDNVVAREVIGGILRHEDGAYEATVELIRLSDGMVVGRGSALCGTKGDDPWTGRAEPARRSMAVTRATSRAFRQQYSWIMALAGYEPTPAEEMPSNEPPAQAARVRTDPDGLIGKLVAQGQQDFQLRETPTGWVLPFRVKEGNKTGQIVAAHDAIAVALNAVRDTALGARVTVWGTFSDESYEKGGATVRYQVLHLTRITGPDFEIPAQMTPEEAFDAAEREATYAAAAIVGVGPNAETLPLPLADISEEEAAAIVAQELQEAAS